MCLFHHGGLVAESWSWVSVGIWDGTAAESHHHGLVDLCVCLTDHDGVFFVNIQIFHASLGEHFAKPFFANGQNVEWSADASCVAANVYAVAVCDGDVVCDLSASACVSDDLDDAGVESALECAVDEHECVARVALYDIL